MLLLLRLVDLNRIHMQLPGHLQKQYIHISFKEYQLLFILQMQIRVPSTQPYGTPVSCISSENYTISDLLALRYKRIYLASVSAIPSSIKTFSTNFLFRELKAF